MNKRVLGFGIVVAIFAACSMLTEALAGANNTTQTDTLSVTIEESCSFSRSSTAHKDGTNTGTWGTGDGANVLSFTMVNGMEETNIGSSNFEVVCNDGGGYDVTVEATDLETDSDYDIPFLAAEPSSEHSSWGIFNGTEWVDSGGKVSTSTTTTAKTEFTVTYGVAISATQPASSYTATATYTFAHPFSSNTDDDKYLVSYYDGDRKVYQEVVKKGNDVINVPEVPNKRGYDHGEWLNDGKDVDGNMVIRARYYNEVTVVSTMAIGQDQTETPLVEIVGTFPYRMYEDDGNIIYLSRPVYDPDNSVYYGEVSVNYEVIAQVTSNKTATKMGWSIGGVTVNDKYTVNGDVTITVDVDGCILKGSEVSMADGSVKKIEDIKVGDEVLAYDIYGGKLSATRVYSIMAGKGTQPVIKLMLSDGKMIEIVDNEYVFDTDLKEFVLVNTESADDMIGKNLMVNNGGEIGVAKVVSVNLDVRRVEYYTMVTENYVNYIANGIVLNLPVYFVNDRYIIGKDYRVDMEQYAADVEKYGVYSYDDLKDVCTLYTFEALNLKDYSIVVGKGLMSFDEFKAGIKAIEEEINLYNGWK